MGRLYFPVVSVLILALSVWGFSDNLFWNVGQPSNRDPKFVAHGLSCLAWMMLFAVQANLVRLGNVRLHRKLGVAGMVAAAGVTITTIHVFVAVWKGWDAMPSHIQANRLLLPSYSLFVLLGFLRRRRADWHRRCMLVATLYMMEPILSRAFDPLDPLLGVFTDAQVDTAWWIFFVSTWNGLFLSLFAYDWKTARRLHPASIVGYAWFWAIWVIVLVL